MRAILNISVPQKLKDLIEEEAAFGGYASKSEFLRDVIRSWQRQRLLEDIRISRREFKQGKGKVLKSLKDLR
jgi:Arc/MetJ-type ribon-helix-helix transcriptional regulator